ncbi:MAG TPA: hypothetical protein VKA60_21965 [Blastocatellia bacterium]|nr:hypothetical protein [Blastocatellia bacterium]
MKTCPECGIALKDEYQFCPEDGAPLDVQPATVRSDESAASKPQTTSAVVLYCPACAAEYPLTFSECPVHHTALTTHAMPSRLPADESSAEETAPAPTQSARRLHLVSGEGARRGSALEAYEQTLENLAHPVADQASEVEALPQDAAPAIEERKHRVAAIVISVALCLLGLIGLYAVISNASRRPASSSAKSTGAKKNSPQPTITVQTPQAAADYQEAAPSNPPHQADRDETAVNRSQADDAQQAKPRRDKAEMNSPATRGSEARPPAPVPEQAAARRVQPAETVQPAMMRQSAATELVLPRGTFGLVAARLTGVRAARTANGYRYDLTFHMADQAGHATQWERLAIVTRANSGATRQQQIPFFHRLGADGTLSFTVSVELPGRAPADWQGRIICTSIGSDSSGKTYRASFGANVSPN